MRIPLHRTRKWERAAARGSASLERLVWAELHRRRKKRAAWRSRQLTRSIPKARRQQRQAEIRELRQQQAEHRVLAKAGLR